MIDSISGSPPPGGQGAGLSPVVVLRAVVPTLRGLQAPPSQETDDSLMSFFTQEMPRVSGALCQRQERRPNMYVFGFLAVPCGLWDLSSLKPNMYVFGFLAVPCGLWDLSSLTRDWTRALGSETVGS